MRHREHPAPHDYYIVEYDGERHVMRVAPMLHLKGIQWLMCGREEPITDVEIVKRIKPIHFRKRNE